MGTRRRILWATALGPIALLLGVVAAWAIDTGSAGGEVLRNVELAGGDIGGLAADELLERIEALDAEMTDRPVRIVTPDVTYDTTAGQIGLSVDQIATAEAALDEGRTAALPARPFGWVASFVAPHDAPVRYVVHTETARKTVRELEGDSLVAPVEPTIGSLAGQRFTVVPGKAGSGIDPETLAVALAAAAERTPFGEPVEVRIRQTDLSPRLADSVAEAAAARANALTDTTLSVTAADLTIQLVPSELRSMVVVSELEDSIAVGLDREAVLAVLDEELAPVEVPAKSATVTLVDGVPTVSPSVTGLGCCDESHVDAVQRTFETGAASVTLDLVETQPALTTEEAQALGIVEEVGSPDEFGPTTNHACCQNRVTNIHRIADIVRGAIIEPGETFSVNDHVGRRTIDKGFVADGVIYDGELTEDVGGGVSQFATTLFNAALFAGLDFGEYQSHSLYISRYPRGHEATISFPHPDLEIINNSPYGVMIWPEYTDTSLTVRLFSTRHVDVQVGEPTPSPSGNCTRWTTPRVRTYPDGSTAQDSVSARYRPEEGVDC
jgi:vancomycin resistance protein YoaR